MSSISAMSVILSVTAGLPIEAASGVMDKGGVHFNYDEQGVSGLACPKDPYGAQTTAPDRPLGLIVRYRAARSDWKDLDLSPSRMKVDPKTGVLKYTLSDREAPIGVVQTFSTDGTGLDWDIELTTTKDVPVEIGDLAVTLSSVGPRGENPKEIFELGFVKHQFISGSGSFLYFVRASGAPPFLTVTVHRGTHLEYFGRGPGRGGGSQLYIHSGLSGGDEKRGTWRQEHTFLKLGPKGAKDGKAHYGFRFQFAESYDDLRDILYREGLFDIRAVPGMTIPEDLTARFSLRTKASIESIDAEFPEETTITELGEPKKDCRVYEVEFKRLGENMLTIRHDGGRKTYLEYFVTEPIETLIKKRALFIINRQQIRDPSKWWDGVFGPYDMENRVVRTIDDPDIFTDRMVYVLTCDDPGLCKAPYVAAKNAVFPDKKEIEGLEYYLDRFVWGKMQRTDKEDPYPYGVYGTPHWYIDRDPERRKAYTDRDLDKEHVWRSYDYPHVVMLYYHMYEIAKKYPDMSKYLDAGGYLERAYQTARAFFIYPYEIYWSYYETYKWGLYNELVVLNLSDALDREGFPERAAWLRAEWEKKVKYFVYDDRYPFRSEYAFDRTAFESSYAFAKYGAVHDMKPDQNLWFDVKLKKWYSHPNVRREDSRAFMDRQLAAGLSVRGRFEASYYQLGADMSMSYMAAMGGWGILDYAVNFAHVPYDWLQLGYASYLSSWCLMNTGRPETNYGYWFPGEENDGAAGWQFSSSKYGHAWMGDDVPRGPWRYDGEIDLGYCGALRMASTVVTKDPIFDWIAYGGAMTIDGEVLSIVPRDGLRQRFAAVIPDLRIPWSNPLRLKLEFDRDGFMKDAPIVVDKSLGKIIFTVENRTHSEHVTGLRLSIPPGSAYKVLEDGNEVSLSAVDDWDYPLSAQLKMVAETSKIEIVLVGSDEATGSDRDQKSE